MDVDTTSIPDINDVVRKAREQLAGVITSLTQVLAAVASSDDKRDKPATNGPNPDSDKHPDAHARRSLAPVLSRFDNLRKAVEQAVSAHAAIVANAEKDEADVTPEQRAALVDRRAALVDDVRAKNDKIKILIDHLRELHRDIVILLASYYKPLSSGGSR